MEQEQHLSNFYFLFTAISSIIIIFIYLFITLQKNSIVS